jgi:hypothetical protein
MRKSRQLLIAVLIGVLVAAVAVPALAASGSSLSTKDHSSGHANVWITTKRGGPNMVLKTLTIQACDDRKDGAGIVAAVAVGDRGLSTAARRGVGTCGPKRSISTTKRLFVSVCRQDASRHGPFEVCRNDTL